jgi:glucose/arabinose dehydrogenase
MLITEKVGPVWLVTQKGEKTEVANVPAVLYGGQGGMLGVFTSPRYATDRYVYLTYSEPGDGGSSLALARAELSISGDKASLDRLEVLWRQMPKGKGGQFGAQIAFSPDGQYLFLTVGERQRMTPAQDPDQELGKILRLTLDGKPAPGNPGAGKTGAASVTLIDPPSDTEAAKTARSVSRYPFPVPNVAPAEIWSSGHRTPYGLAFAPDGRLWEVEHGPRGGDELNLIEPGKNYGWPVALHGIDYPGQTIGAGIVEKEGIEQSRYYWDPVIAPSGLAFYTGNLFPQWKNSVFIGALRGQMLDRLELVGDKVVAEEPLLVDLHSRIRDVRIGPEGAVYVLTDSPDNGKLLKLTPK